MIGFITPDSGKEIFKHVVVDHNGSKVEQYFVSVLGVMRVLNVVFISFGVQFLAATIVYVLNDSYFLLGAGIKYVKLDSPTRSTGSNTATHTS